MCSGYRGGGFIPSYIVHTLIRRNDIYQDGIRIICLCRNEEKAKKKFGEYYHRNDFMVLIQDVCDKDLKCMHADIIIYAASPANPYICEKEPVDTMKANTIGLINYLDKAVEWKTDLFLFFSSAKFYETVKSERGEDGRFLDSTTINYKYAYGMGKRTGELLCKCYEKQYNLDVLIARPFIVYGPGTPLDQKSAFSDFVVNVLKGENIVLKSEGKAIRSYCYVKDAVTGIFTVLLKGESGEAYNIASNEDIVSIRQLAQLFLKFNPKVKIESNFEYRKSEYLNSITDILTADTQKLNALGWVASTRLEEGILRTIESYM